MARKSNHWTVSADDAQTAALERLAVRERRSVPELLVVAALDRARAHSDTDVKRLAEAALGIK